MALVDDSGAVYFGREYHGSNSLLWHSGERTNPLGECVGLYYKSVCSCGRGGNSQARWQFGADDYLYFSLEPALCIAYPCVFSADRTSLADDLLGSFLADNAEGMFGAGRTDVISTSY